MNKIINFSEFKKISSNVLCDEQLTVESESLNYFGKIYEENSWYERISKKDIQEISNFIIKPIYVIEDSSSSSLNAEIRTKSGHKYIKTFKMSDFMSSTSFKKAINEVAVDLVFSGKTDDLESIKAIIFSKPYITKKGIAKTGIFKHGNEYVFVGNDVTIDSNGNQVNDIAYTGKGIISSNIDEIQPINKKDLSFISKSLFNFNDLSVTASVLGFCGFCFLKERLYNENGTKATHLFMWGEAGAGKSDTIESIIMPIFSIDQSTSADQCTKFVSMLFSESSNVLPFIIEEFKPTRLSKTKRDEISALIRNLYDMTLAFRGNIKRELDNYSPSTPLIIAGEMATEESASKERTIVTYFSKAQIKSCERKESFKLLKGHKELLSQLGRGILQEALSMESDELIYRYRYLEENYAKELPNRVKNNIINCMLGLWIIKDLYENIGLQFEKETGYEIEDLYRAVEINAIEKVLNGKKEVRGIVEITLETLNEMVEAGEVREGFHYQVINNGTELSLKLSEVYPQFIRYISANKIQDVDVLPKNQFIEQLKYKEYYIGTKTTVFTSENSRHRVKGHCFNIDKLKHLVDLSNFLQ